MAKKNGKAKAKFPQIKKNIKDFVLSEEGKISQKNIAKLGVSLAILGMMLQPESAQAQHASHSSHSNGFFRTATDSGHTSNTIHWNVHANHGNHGRGGWC
jgi:hypothetical protein